MLLGHWFLPLAYAQEKLDACRSFYNEERPHGAFGHKPPISLQNPGGASSLPP
jgi:putative transposase